MAAGHNHNGMVLFGDHQESNRTCTDLHALARFNGNQMTGWTPLRHHMNNIYDTLYQYLDKPDDKWTKDQQAGFASLKTLLKSNIPSNPQAIVSALDKLLFSGLMAGRLTVSVMNRKGSYEGETAFTRDVFPRTPFVTIKIDDFDAYKNQPAERRARIVGSLVHEMCHAFLLIYGCDGRQCATKESVMYGIGFTGHGPVWEKIANEAEDIFAAFISPIMLPDLEIPDSLGIPLAVREEREYRKKWF
jgi:hypothetical protein